MKNLKNKIVDDQSKIGSFITELRKQRGMTQDELATRLSTSQSAVARMERGEQNFSTDMLIKISNALNKDVITLSSGALNFKIEGGRELSGHIKTNVSKNAVMGLLSATLLNQGKTVLKNVPKIEEVYRMIEVLQSIGVSIKWSDNDLHIKPPKVLELSKLDSESAVRTRSIIMFLGPIIHLCQKFSLPMPGGCKLGVRTNTPHFLALEKLGVKITKKNGDLQIVSNNLKANEIVLYESGDTATENAIMAASKIEGVTTIKYASANYMVQDVCFFLQKLGVQIEGIGTSTLKVHGKKDINCDIEYYPSEDPIESMLFLTIAITTNSSIIIERCPIQFLELELLKLELMGFKYKILKRYKANNGMTDLVDIQTFPSKLTALHEKIYARPYPGLNIDNLPFFVPIVAKAKGRTLIHDWIYENRAIYYTELCKLGAQINLADIHRVYIDGPTTFTPSEVVCPPALRPAAIILASMLAAKGTSILRNVYSINRGYEDIALRLNKIGAKIEEIRGL